MSQDQLLKDDKNSHLSPAVRARLQKCYEFGNQKMQAGEYDYANEMFGQCYLGSPGNLIYLQSFIANLRLKYGNNKKGASFAKLKGGGQKTALKVAETRSKWEDVLKAGCELIKINPWDSAVYFSMGKAALALGYDETGLALLKHAVECNPTDAETNRYAAKTLAERELFDDAIACCQRILNVKSNDYEANGLMKDLLLQKTMKHMERKKTEAEKAAEERGAAKISEEDDFEKRLAKTPDDHDLWTSYIDFFNQRGNRRKEEETLRRALKQFPDDQNMALRLDEVRKERAKNELTRIRDLYQKTPSDETKAKYLEAKKVFDAASLTLIQRKLTINPNSTPVHYEFGLYQMARGQFREAIGELQKAQLDDSLKADCFLAIAQCFEQIKQYKLALTHYEKGIAAFGKGIDSESGKKTLYFGARLAAGLGDYQKAEKMAEQLAAIDFSYKDVGALLDKISKKLQN